MDYGLSTNELTTQDLTEFMHTTVRCERDEG